MRMKDPFFVFQRGLTKCDLAIRLLYSQRLSAQRHQIANGSTQGARAERKQKERLY